jgi:hypothetical protein
MATFSLYLITALMSFRQVDASVTYAMDPYKCGTMTMELILRNLDVMIGLWFNGIGARIGGVWSHI